MKISEKLLDAIVKYLSRCPYADVAGIMGALQQEIQANKNEEELNVKKK